MNHPNMYILSGAEIIETTRVKTNEVRSLSFIGFHTVTSFKK